MTTPSCCRGEDKTSCCEGEGKQPPGGKLSKYLLIGTFALIAWGAVYSTLGEISRWVAYTCFQLEEGSQLGASVEFFALDVPKVLMLLVLVVFVIGVVRSFFTPERTRSILAGKKEFVGNVLAALLGVVTPFCSCSAVPLFIGFVATGIPLGVTFSFLISAPMVNEIALVLLYGLFGWKIALLYLITGLMIAIVSGWVLGRLHMEKYVEDWVQKAQVPVQVNTGQSEALVARLEYGAASVKDIVGKVWIYVVIGIAVGAGIHGYVPEEFMASMMGEQAWWSVPLSVLIGVPLYSNAAGIIPIVQALLEKGAALGTVLAFMMAVIGLSLPEVIILRKVLKPRLILVFIAVVAFGILCVGYLFNFLV